MRVRDNPLPVAGTLLPSVSIRRTLMQPTTLPIALLADRRG